MKKSDIKHWIGSLVGLGNYDDWSTDIAWKIYFFPLSSALLTQTEWADCMTDDTFVKPHKKEWVVKELGDRLLAIIKEMIAKKEIPQEIYLTVIVYGLSEGADDHTTYYYDFFHNADQQLTYSVRSSGEMSLNNRQTATVLAALRHFQASFPHTSDMESAFPDHFSDENPLSHGEIDKLCERLNS